MNCVRLALRQVLSTLLLDFILCLRQNVHQAQVAVPAGILLSLYGPQAKNLLFELPGLHGQALGEALL